MLLSRRVPDTRVARTLEIAVDALFAIVAVVLLDALLLPIPLTVALTCTECFHNVPRLPVVPFIAALAVSLGMEADGGPLSRRLVRGLALGAAAAAYASLVLAAAIPFHDAYFTTPYRVYAIGYLGLATALATYGVIMVGTAGRPPSYGRFSRRLALVGLVAIVAATTRGDLLIAASALAGALIGVALTRTVSLRGTAIARITPNRAAIAVAFTAVALRLLFGLQTLARTGPGHAFAVASDDGEAYYRNATELLADPAYIDTILRAADGFPPLYSLFLWAIFAVTRESMAAVIVVQAVLAGLACALVYVLARRYQSAWVGVIAGLLFATDQNLIQNQSTLTTEAVFVPLLLFGLLALILHWRERSLAWLLLAAVSIALVFFTRNLVALVIPAAVIWLLWLRPRRPLHALGAGVALVTALLVVASPVAIATGRTEARPRITNQLADTGWEHQENTPYVIENGFLVARGIKPFSDPGGSLAAIIRDPLPVLGFYLEAVPQRVRYLFFSVEPGSADPLTITNPATYPNRYGQLVDLLLLLSAAIAVAGAIRQRAWRAHPELVLFALFVLLYVALFAFVFPPRQAFRYRIPIVPLLMIAQAVGLWLLARGVARGWTPVR